MLKQGDTVLREDVPRHWIAYLCVLHTLQQYTILYNIIPRKNLYHNPHPTAEASRTHLKIRRKSFGNQGILTSALSTISYRVTQGVSEWFPKEQWNYFL